MFVTVCLKLYWRVAQCVIFHNYPKVISPLDIPERSIAFQSSEEEDWEGEMQLQLQTQRNIKDIPQ